MSEAENGQFVVSLDFELFWGVRDHASLDDYRSRLQGTREVIPALLDLFASYDIHATWATVGFLFADGRQEVNEYIPSTRPRYERSKFSPYAHLETTGASEREDPYHYAPSLIDRIAEVPGQEIGSHTFSHYFCMEVGQSRQAWRADLVAARDIAREKDAQLESLVFPRNQYRSAYLQDCRELGFRCFRGKPDRWMYRPRRRGRERLIRRAARLLDAHLPLAGKLSQEIGCERGLRDVVGSRFLRPWTPKSAPFAGWRRRRIRREISHAAREGETYHLWWHPHNFGLHSDRNLSFLRSILDHFAKERDRRDMRSVNMREAASRERR
ncbi:MAG: polysaccharide deacetylase family protein [Bradymonadaceae bacterium]